MPRHRKFWGWGYEGEGPDAAQAAGIARALAKRFGLAHLDLAPEPRLEDLSLRKPRVAPPASAGEFCSTSLRDRASHTYGKSYRDSVRGARGEFSHPPDFVAFPRSEEEIVAILDWCSGAGVAAIPYGGGSSVVGGVEANLGSAYRGAVSIDMGRLNRVLEVGGTLVIGTPDHDALAWRIIGGVYQWVLPFASRDEHITQYTRYRLTEELAQTGFAIVGYRYIAGGEMIMECVKREDN